MTVDLATRPRVTLVVAMRNEAANIRRCLASIADQDYPADRLEVLVYDGQSTDDSIGLARAFAAGRRGWAVRTNPRRIQAAAWNDGIQAASGDVAGIVSGHTELGREYVGAAVDTLLRMEPDLVGGPVRAVADLTDGRRDCDRNEHSVWCRWGPAPLPDGARLCGYRVHGRCFARDMAAIPVQ